MKHLLLFIILFFSWSFSYSRSTEWSLHLDSKLNTTQYNSKVGDDTDTSVISLELNPLFNWKYKDSLRLNMKPLFIATQTKSSEEEFFFDPQDSHLNFSGENSSLRAGYNLFSWGNTDGFNPLDVINPKQYFDPIHSKKMGVLSLTFSKSLESFDYDLIYIPQTPGAVLPGTKSRWLPREVYIPETPDNDLILNLPANLKYHYGTNSDLNSARENNLAARISFHSSTVDLTLSGYEGAAGFPLIQPVVTGTVIAVSPKTILNVDPDVTLNTTFYRIRHGGISFTSNQFNFLFKYAGAYTQSLGDNPALPGWTQENVLGLEKNFNFLNKGSLIAVLQHSFTQSQRQNDSNLSFSQIFKKSWMFGFKGTWDESWSYSLVTLYDEIKSSHYEEVEIGKRIYDIWLCSLRASFIEGPTDSPLGVYKNNDSLNFQISRSF